MLIPTKLPSNRNFMLESAYLPVNGVGGDFFQVLPLKDDSMLIVVGDVSGKGLQAAMNASTLVGALRNELSHDPATILNNLNHVLVGATPLPSTGTSVKTVPSASPHAVCARVYPDGTITISNAGHLSPYRDGREMELAADLPLGVIPDMQYRAGDVSIERGRPADLSVRRRGGGYECAGRAVWLRAHAAGEQRIGALHCADGEAVWADRRHHGCLALPVFKDGATQ